MNFSKAIKQMRLETGMAQADLALALGINVATVSRWENGHNLPNSPMSEKIINVAERRHLSKLSMTQLKNALNSEVFGVGVNNLNQIPSNVINQIINEESPAIYICDCETYDLLYINQQTAKMLHSPIENATGRKCYEYLMGIKTPCPFCSMQKKPLDSFSTVEFSHPDTGRHYLMRGKRLDWNGRQAHIEYVTEDVIQHYKHTAVNNMVDCLPCGIGVFHQYLDGRLEMVRLNESFYKMLNTTPEVFQKYYGFHFIKSLHPSDQIAATTSISDGIRSKKGIEFTVRIAGNQQNYQWIRVLGTTAFYDGEKTTLYLSFMNVDSIRKKYQQMQKYTDITRFLSEKGYLSIGIYNITNNQIETLFDAESELGYPAILKNGPEEMVSRGDIHENDIVEFLSMYRDIRAGKTYSESTVRLLNHRTNKFEWQHIQMNRVNHSDGGDNIAIGFSTNAEQQKDAEARYEYELKVKQEQIQDSLSYFRINLTKRTVEELHSKVFDVSSVTVPVTIEALIEKGLLEGVIDSDRMLVQQILDVDYLMKKYHQGHRVESLIYRRVFPGKGIRWVEGTISKVKRTPSNDIIAFYTTRDIDRARKAQMAVLNVLEEETENIILLNPNTGMVQYIMENRAMVNFHEESACRSFAMLQKTLEDNVIESDLTHLQSFLDIPTIQSRLENEQEIQCTYCVQSEIGSKSYKKTRVFYLDDSKTEILYIQRDVTNLYAEEQRQKEVLQAIIDKEHLANQAKSAFLANMSHDLRTPLNAMLGFTALTFDEAQNPTAVKEYMTKMRAISDYMISLVNDILDASRLQSSALNLQIQPYTYSEFMLVIKTMFTAQFAQKGVTLSISGPNTISSILVDKVRLNQVAFNLLSNALKFTPAGGHVDFIINNLKTEQGYVWFDFIIKDTGIGMSKEFQQKLFEPFAQENTAITVDLEGAGLGLYITKNLVNQMGGTISIVSERGKGTVVTVQFSFKKASDAEILENDLNDAADTYDFFLQGRTILLAEDHPMNSLIAEKLLQKHGATVICAKDGLSAVERFNASAVGSFDAILMDIRMPLMDGNAATKEIRALEREDAATVPIIAMSANAFDEDKLMSIEAGMNEHLSKPVEPSMLFSTLKKVLHKNDG